jgi:hypothetical protein
MRHATRLLVLVGALATPATIIAMCAATVLAETPDASARLEGTAHDATHDEAGASTTQTTTGDPEHPDRPCLPADRPCFPVSMPVWVAGFHGDEYVTGWASVDRTAHFAGRSCEIKGWAPEPCARRIPAYLANCPDGAFTFTKTEADCYEVLGCRDPHATAGYGASR